MLYKSTLSLIVLALLLLTGDVCGQVTVEQDRDIYTLENSRFRLEVDSAAGGRIRSWLLKPSGRELIALWKGANEIGGALDDRAFFTAARYRAAIMRPGPEVGALRLEARHSSGLSVIKLLTLRKDSPSLDIYYEFRNGTQTPQRLFIRNFFLPGNRPQSDEHLYWVNADTADGGKPVEGATDAHGYYPQATPAFAALWDKATGDGVMVLAPGADKFYFWRGSREFPTFEWIYEDVPPGKILRADVRIVALSGETTAPDWRRLASARDVRKASLRDLPGWIDEAAKFGVTDEERRRGFWLSTGTETGKERLPDSLPLDLPREDERYLSVTLNCLKDFKAAARVEIPKDWREEIDAFWETPGKDRRELLPPPQQPFAFKSGARERIWLRVRSGDLTPGEYSVPLRLIVSDASLRITLHLHVWPIKITAKRPFHVRGYCGGFPVWTGGYDVNEAKLRRLAAILRAYADIGGDVLDWNCVWYKVVAKTKIAGTDENLAEVAKAAPEHIDLKKPPRLDFSYFDPWFEMAKRYGVTRVETYMSHPSSSRWQWVFLDPALGKGCVKFGTPEAERVIVWFYREMKRYLEAKDLEGFFCKISDEISPEHIPNHIETAKIVREAGWRPFTTITGMIARTAEHIRAMNPYCDEWQLSFGLKDDFLALIHRKFELAQQRHELKGPWGQYRNGGAEATWATKVFGEEGGIGVSPRDVEKFQLLEDGKPLRIKGGSPWGNKDRGVVITAGSLRESLYVSPTDGANPDTHRYELQVTMRRESPRGKPLVAIDPTDEIWCYGGGSRPFRGAYSAAWCYPMMTLYHGFRGYGLWAFYHWNKTERIIWVDDETCRVTVSPAYCGYRDGWRDALLFSQLIERRGRDDLEKIVGEGKDALLRVDVRSREVYNFKNILNAGDPVAVNSARRQALRALATSTGGE